MTTLLYGLSLLAGSLAVFAAIIFVHELGHAVAAKLVGIPVCEFKIFFGRTLFEFQVGETRCQVGWLPFGGYVVMPSSAYWNYLNEEKKEALRQENPAAYSLISNRYQWIDEAETWKQVVVYAAGPAVNIISGVLIFVALLWNVGLTVPVSPLTVESVTPNSAAAVAGFRPGDRIIALNERAVAHLKDIEEMDASERKEMHFCVRRNEALTPNVSRKLTLVLPMDELGPASHYDPVGLVLKSSSQSELPKGKNGEKLETAIFRSEANLKRSCTRSAIETLMGPVGMLDMLAEHLVRGVQDTLVIFAEFSIGIAVFNLLPFGTLDGGRILTAVLNRRVNTQYREGYEPSTAKEPMSTGNVLVILAFLGLMLGVTIFDIIRLFY